MSFATKEGLEGVIGADRVRDLFDDDRDGALSDVELQSLQECLSEANDFVVAQLTGKGYSGEDMTELAKDRALRRCGNQIAADIAGDRRPEFRDDQGNSAYFSSGERARAYLKAFSRQEVRSRVEPAAGKPSTLRARISSPTPNSVFGRDPSDPNDLNGGDRGF